MKAGDRLAGWIKLHRQLLDSLVFDNPDLLKVWIWCLLKASHREYKTLVGFQEVELRRAIYIRKKESSRGIRDERKQGL